MTTDASDVLEAFIRETGLPVTRHEKWSLINGGFPGFRVFMTPSARTPNVSNFIVDVTVNKHQTIHEEFVAIGERHEGLTDGFRAFTQIMLPVCLSALCDYAEEGTSSVWEAELGGKNWGLHIGNLIGRSLNEISPPPIDHDFIDVVLQALSKRNLTREPHWVSWFYSGAPGERKATAALDNAPWSALAAQLNAVDWPEGEAYYSYRNFAMLMPR